MATEIVAEYLERKSLNEMGYRQEVDDLSCWEVEAFAIIGNEIASVRNSKIDKLKKPRGRR